MKPNMKLLASALAVCLMLAGCGGSTEIPVQQVSALSQGNTDTVTDRFAGVVVSENAVEIKKENEKTVKELYVQEGDQVSEGDKLFSYDADELTLTLDKQKLEVDRLVATIDEKKEQIESVKSDLESASGSEETQLNIQLRQIQTELTQAEYDKAAKQKDVDHTQKMLEDVEVKSPISGTIRQINEQGEGAFITIQQSGAYEVKGTLNEMSLNAGIMEGVPVTILSRTDAAKKWNGTVRTVDYNAVQSDQDNQSGYYMGGMMSDADGMTNSSSYPFYIELESSEGLLLGQHVYIQIGQSASASGSLSLPENYVMEVRYDEQNACNVAQVWLATQQGKLKKTEVILGEYDPAAGAYPILEGLTESDFIADPANPGCADGAQVSFREVADFTGNEIPTEPEQQGDPGADAVPDGELEPLPGGELEPLPEEEIQGSDAGAAGDTLTGSATPAQEG